MWIFNPFTGNLDWTISLDDYLKIDQTTPQTVENGAPTFDQGIKVTKDNYIVLSE